MKVTKFKMWILGLLGSTFLVVAIVILRFDVIAKVNQIGIGNALVKIHARLTNNGIASLWSDLVEKLRTPFVPQSPSLSYSLYDRSSYPPTEKADVRNALPEYTVIPGADVGQLPPSREFARRFDTWHRSNGDELSTKYSSLDQIRRENVKHLEVAWTYSSRADLGDPAKNGLTVETNPIIADGKLFITNVDGYLICIDAGTGTEIWRLNLPEPVARRGLIWAPDDDHFRSRLFVPSGNGVYAVNPTDGQILSDFGNNGRVGNEVSLIAPVIVKGKLIVATVSPAVEAYDLRTGRLLWTRPLLEKVDPKDLSFWGGVPWGGMSADPARSAVFVSTGNPRPQMYGVTRPGENRYSDSVVAINADTGELLWAFQEVSHDLWDMDVPAAPVLTTITKDGKRIDVVAAVTKLGNTLLLDRDFGRPIFDYRLKRAPVSTVPGEQTSPYQPAVESPEPFSKLVFAEADVTDISQAAQQTVRRKIKGATFGFFVPPVLGGRIVLYCLHGGAEWPGAAVDPRNAFLYVPSNQVPWIIRAGYRDVRASAELAEKVPGDSLYQAKCARCHRPDRDGYAEGERVGDAYFPTLTGITLLRDRNSLTSKPNFDQDHYGLGLDKEITSEQLEALFNYFSQLDQTSDRERSFSVQVYWQLLLDDKGFPGSKPPWGLLTAIDLNTGKKVWQVPFGEYEQLWRNGAPVTGQRNFGGVMVTAGNLLFATGTIDKKFRAYDSSNGRELWSFQLPAAGSAPPATYFLRGSQYVVVVASGGMYAGSSGRSDKVIAFKLPDAHR